jgi:DNA-directed RNA polymerase beta' subunit
LKKEGKRDNDIAERFLTIAENRVKRLAKLIEITAPPIIIDNEINLIRKAYYVLAVIGFKNTLEVEYFEKTLKDKE